MYDTGRYSPQRASANAKYVAFWSYFFRAVPFPATLYPPLPSQFSSLNSPISHFTPEVNKRLRYRCQNAISVIKTHERNSVSEHVLFLPVRQSRLARGIMFSTRPFDRPSVRSFVCYQLVNAIFRKRMNRFQCKLAQISPGARA